MSVFHNIKLVFVRIPKTASTTINESLYSMDCYAKYFTNTATQHKNIERNKHETIKEILSNYENSFLDDYYKVAFVRNPWSWVVSYYHYLSRSSDIIIKDGVFTHSKLRQMKQNIKNTSFSDFLRIVEEKVISENGGSQADNPFRPQHEYIIKEGKNILVDFIGKYENLNNDWKFLYNKLKLDQYDIRNQHVNLSHKNISNTGDYRTHYCDEDIERVSAIYKKDIDFFDYSF